MLTEKLISKIKAVLDSDLTPYRIAKEVGYASANPIHKLKSGESKIENMQLSTVSEFEKLYEEMVKVEKEIKSVITLVENGERNLVNDYDFHEIDFTDGASEIFIQHRAEGHEEITLLFAERDFVKEMRDAVYAGEKEAHDLEELVEGLNDLEDQFDYYKVVGYRIDGGQITWI